ncbi:MAG: PDZ domain-containing protein, partial [Bacteroidota bacterium]
MLLKNTLLSFFILILLSHTALSQDTRLVRQPSLSESHITFVYGSDIWLTDHEGNNLRRITSTAAVESNPYLSPDGKWIAFSSNRSGPTAVYLVSIEGGIPKRLTWHPSAAQVRGWTPDGKRILYASNRESAPSSFNRLWTVSTEGGPSDRVSAQWGYDGSYSPNGNKMIIDRVSRWDVEWRAYRGGQNTPLAILDLKSHKEDLLPNEKTTDIQPIWVGDEIFFLSDRDWAMNVWAYAPKSKKLRQVSKFSETDAKWLAYGGGKMMVEQDGYLHWLNMENGETKKLSLKVAGDFPWAEVKWEDVGSRARSVSLSPTGKRALMEARGEIFTVPIEHGDSRNITQSSNAADRNPLWSPKGDKIAWFSDAGGEGYALYLADQDGLSKPSRIIPIGESKLAWNPIWSPDAKHIAFVDDDVRIRVLELESGSVTTVDIGGNNLDRGRTALAWSPDSKKLAYVKSGSNNFRRIMVWDSEDQSINALTNEFADSFAPSWDQDKKHFYFLASTDLALGSGWANTSAMQARPRYAAYVIVLAKDQDSPFIPRSDEEEVKEEKKKEDDSTKGEKAEEKEKDKGEKKAGDAKKKEEGMKIDYDRVDRRTIALPIPVANYAAMESGSKGSVFIAEYKQGSRGATLHKFTLKDRKAKEFASGIRQFTVSTDHKKILLQMGPSWKIAGTAGPNAKAAKPVKVKLKMKLNRQEEWKQIFEEAWRYERDYFYDPNLHGRDWQKVYDRYAPLVSHVQHRSDLNYILDQVNGELSVGHSFVFGGDFPKVDRSEVGMLGADFVAEKGRWKISRIYTTESWNPSLSSPLDRPGLKAEVGNYLLGVNGKELTTDMDPYELLDGTSGNQTVIHLNDKAEFENSWKETVEPIRSERALRQRAWVEDNRRKVDELSGGRLAYVWVPNTSGNGFVSFNRYYFAQQDKEGAVIDERFNGGGLLDDYMVDLMTRSLRASITNEVPNGKPFRLPAGILGPKALLINEMAGSGGDFFPWVFRQQKAGPLIGATTWGGLVKSSVHYALVDGGALTSPDNAVFDPINNK